MKQAFFGALNLLSDTLWPRICLVCDSDADVGRGNVCRRCWHSLTTAGEVPDVPGIDHLYVAFSYDDRLRQIVHQFKFNRTPVLAEPLGEQFAGRLRAMGFDPRPGVLVPVPDHPSRRRERGFNPALELAQALSGDSGLPCRADLAQRLEAGVHQSSLPDEQRRRALKNAFALEACEHPNQQTLYLVDDVIHTGTTLKRLAAAARKSGWKRIDALCLCT